MSGANSKKMTPTDTRQTVLYRQIFQAESSAQHLGWLRTRQQDYGSAVRARLEAGLAVPAAAYIESLRLRAAWLERFCAQVLGDAFLLLVDHFGQAADLAFDPAEAFLTGCLDVFSHAAYIPLQGIGYKRRSE